MLSALWAVATDVGGFWQNKAYDWWTTKSPRDALLDALEGATTYEDWQDAALKLDDLLTLDLWRRNDSSKYYDWRLINERCRTIADARDDEDVIGLVNLLRSGLLRNLGNITAPSLYNRAYAGTKLLIDEYVTQVSLAVQYITALPASQSYESGWTAQTKLDLLHDTRQAFGRTTLVLQGGAIFGLCHLGVVKALHLRGLLPRIITGTATGALIAALVGIHTEDELLGFLNGDGIDLTAFSRHRSTGSQATDEKSLLPESGSALMETLGRRTRRYIREGYFLDVNVLEACVRANVGDTTFEEAYQRTRRVLNITVATSGRGGVPNVLNYLTAPNVLIWSAALASNASSTTLYSPVILRCKDEEGNIVPWAEAQGITFRSWRQASYATERESPLSRVAELFNVNHFVVSQARPYIAPFLRSELHSPNPRQAGATGVLDPLLRFVTGEVHHRLTQLDTLGVLPTGARQLLLDETIPGASITLVPTITAADYLKLLSNPTKESLEYWILRGEKSVWPAVGALKVRCAIEVQLDRGYQLVRRVKPMDGDYTRPRKEGSKGSLKKRERAQSTGQG